MHFFVPYHIGSNCYKRYFKLLDGLGSCELLEHAEDSFTLEILARTK
jgi:hypothetical protein